MTPDQITQLRQILKQIHRWTIEESGIVCPHKFGTCSKHNNKKCPVYLIEEALALLPCSTCNGTGKTNRICVDIEGIEFVAEKDIPCPDCK